LPRNEPLAGNLRDQAGRILVRAGRVLDDVLLARLGERSDFGVYAGADWPDAPAEREEAGSDAAEMAAVLRRLGRQRGLMRVRRHVRQPWRTMARAELEELGAHVWGARQVDVVTEDIAATGFAFECGSYVHPGTRVRLRLNATMRTRELAGVVRYCTHVAGRRHRVGVELATE